MGRNVKLGGKPTRPAPDPNKPYLWIGGKWVLVATDTTDGVPKRLTLPGSGGNKARRPRRR